MSKIELTGHTFVSRHPNPANVSHLEGKWLASAPHIIFNGVSGVGNSPDEAVQDLILNLNRISEYLLKEADTLSKTEIPAPSSFNAHDFTFFTKALDTLGEAGHEVRPYSLSKKCWIQTWPTTACGFGGLGGQGFTDAQTTVLSSTESDAVVVFHNNKFAYLVENPSEKFKEDMHNQKLVGAANFKKDEYDLGPQHLDKNGKRIRMYNYVVFKTSEGITKHLEVLSLLKNGMLKLRGHDELVKASEVKINNLDNA